MTRRAMTKIVSAPYTDRHTTHRVEVFALNEVWHLRVPLDGTATALLPCMRNNAENRRVRDQIAIATMTVDAVSDMQEICLIARDAAEEKRGDDVYLAIISQIPPIKLGRTTYRVVSGGRHGVDLIGPRGGHSCLVRNLQNPDMWAHNTMNGYQARTVWYKRQADGTFGTS